MHVDGEINAPIYHNGGVINAPILRTLNEKAILSIVLREASEEDVLNTTRSLRNQFYETPAKNSIKFSEPGRGKKPFRRAHHITAFAYFGSAYAEQ